MDDQNISNVNPVSTTPDTQENKPATSIGPLVGIIIVVLIIVLGGMYFWGQRIDSGQETGVKNDAATQSLQNQSASDDLASIEADVNNTDLQNIDSEMSQIDADLEASGF